MTKNQFLKIKIHVGDVNIRSFNSKKEKSIIFYEDSKYALIVDDEQFNRKVLQGMIESISNLKILEAGNGIESIEFVKQNLFTLSLIFMDINMPLMNGIEATINIRKICFEKSNYIPIIAVTAFSEENQKKDCLNSGMDFFMNKPVKIKELYEILTKYAKH